MHRLNFGAVDSVDHGPTCCKGNDEEINENDDGPSPARSRRRATRIEGADSQHSAGNDETTTDH